LAVTDEGESMRSVGARAKSLEACTSVMPCIRWG
jgi:hypothetical protein